MVSKTVPGVKGDERMAAERRGDCLRGEQGVQLIRQRALRQGRGGEGRGEGHAWGQCDGKGGWLIPMRQSR